MNLSTKNNLILLGIILISLIGFGYVILKGMESKDPSPQTAKPYKGYVAAPPHYGPIVTIRDINITYKNVVGYAALETKNLEGIKIGQDVALYDQNGIAMPLGGTVQNINVTDNKAMLQIKLPVGTNTELLGDTAKIILAQTIASKRMPLSALQQDDGGENYVWIASKNNEGGKYSVTRQNIIVGTRNDEYFAEGGFIIQAADLIVHNPDDSLKADKTYTIKEIDFSPPLHNPIKQAWVDFEMNYLAQQQANMKQEAQDCRDGKTEAPREEYVGADSSSTPDGSASGSCGNASNFADGTDPLSVFKFLTKPGTTPTSSACSGSNASCAQ